MSDIVGFIRARLAEDEQAARGVADYRGRPGELRWMQADPERHPGLINDQLGNMVTMGVPGGTSRWHAAHIARQDPARTLRRVAAHRAMADTLLSQRHLVCEDPWYTCSAATVERDGGDCALLNEPGPCDCGRDRRVAELLQLLAAEWSDHPDFDPSWSVTP